ncbi:DUF4230 domain-containing protein [Algoriphagus sp. oki45]|uniref:DUF4230 domain-containing protein n=1 Tax=Algoriphagus sp. oki45 TaxID=3067294 RepID=UPI0027F1CE5D|nr:DUF4230 domain-containing protein [Algoriphagus sp. oki45]
MKSSLFKILLLVAFMMGVFFLFRRSEERKELEANSALIQQQVEQVGKLIVTEGNYAKIFSYRNSQGLFYNLLSSDKKALILVNAKATVEYDLRKISTEVDPKTKSLRIKNLPDPVLNIYPDIEYYDVTQGYFNPFSAQDYNKIKQSVTAQIRAQVEKSDLMKNSQQRLLEELTRLYVLTQSLGWTLVYEEQVIGNEGELERLGK